MSEEEEYEVESITEARVEKKKGRNANLIWKFRVRWKGYSQDEDTWEPIESFDDSEHIVTQFWEKTQDPRNIHDLSQFKAGESFLPLGPPRRKVKRKSLTTSDSIDNVTGTSLQAESSLQVADRSTGSGKRQRGVESSEQDRPVKRVREEHGKEYRAPQTSAVNHSNSWVEEHFQTPQKDVELLSSLGSSRRKSKNPQRLPSPEIVPDSDEEVENAMTMIQDTESEAGTLGITIHRSTSTSQSLSDAQSKTLRSSGRRSQIPSSLQPRNDTEFDDVDGSRVPSHRKWNPKSLIPQVDNPNLVGQLSAGSRALGSQKKPSSLDATHNHFQLPSSPSGSRLRPGPGRSSSGLLKKDIPSLLTFQKGTLKTVKGVYYKSNDAKLKAAGSSSQLDIDVLENHELKSVGRGDSPRNECAGNAPPTGEQLLHLAGLNSETAEALPDFEDTVHVQVSTTQNSASKLQVSQQEESSHNPSSFVQDRTANLSRAKEVLFPSSNLSTVSDLENAAWKRSTIFGPLGLASDSSAPQTREVNGDLSHAAPFSLNLDSSISIPVLFIDATPHGSKLFLGMSVTYKTPPGKFYSPAAAVALLDTMRTGGASAKVSLSEGLSDEFKQHFVRFCRRLEGGDLFIGMAGVQLLAFCSSTNSPISQRLNISPNLQGTPFQVLVSKVVVDNYSGYADAASNADNSRWSQYFNSP